MNRVRMGLTGLAFVFLLVLIGAAGTWPFGSGAPKAQEETLATLGVAPGSEEPSTPEAPPEVLATPPLVQPETEPLTIEDTETLTEI